jgi:RNA polymerase sigma-70 factor (ECF subfamily)
VDGAPGIVVPPLGRLFAVLRVTVDDGRITQFDVIAGPAQLDQITLAVEASDLRRQALASPDVRP